MGALLIVALASFSVALVLIRSIVLPLRQSVILAETVATGNLTSQIDVTGSDEPARLMAALRTMQGNLRDTLLAIAQGLTLQNGEIEQAATAINEMTGLRKMSPETPYQPPMPHANPIRPLSSADSRFYAPSML